MKNGDRILDFQDINERFEAERLANERCRKESSKLIVRHRKKIIKQKPERTR